MLKSVTMITHTVGKLPAFIASLIAQKMIKKSIIK